MNTYAEREVFSATGVALWKRATDLVSRLPSAVGGQELRCHEVARALGRVLGLQHQDGFYGFVDHTWLWTTPPDPELGLSIRSRLPNILDVYTPGELPPVQLVHMHSIICSSGRMSPAEVHFGWPPIVQPL